jgi:hypothetical protein
VGCGIMPVQLMCCCTAISKLLLASNQSTISSAAASPQCEVPLVSIVLFDLSKNALNRTVFMTSPGHILDMSWTRSSKWAYHIYYKDRTEDRKS